MRSLPLYREAGPPPLPASSRTPGALPAAILSLHSHRDRSFLDDVALHHLSGALRATGLANDLVVAYLPPGAEDRQRADFDRLVDALRPYPTILYERVWSAHLVARLRAALPEATLVRLVGEHDLSGAPADHVCQSEPRAVVDLLLALTGRAPSGEPPPRYAPNLRPIYATAEARPRFVSFPITGNVGCPYQADARTNPLFEGARIPEGRGRGCAFCTTGNHYEHKPKDEALDWALTQLRYLRANAPEIGALVLRDQNPFYYLTELVEAAEREKLGPFTLLLESRADWFLQNAGRFTRALASAQRSSIVLAPFLVGVESFSQAELDRFNKGTSAETNVRFLEALRRWNADYAPAMDLSHAAFGFILFTPWTTLADLRTNLDAIRKTGMHELRGHLLLSRARLYPDTALYWLAERDGLLADAYARPEDDASARYGYLPARPFRFQDGRAGRVAELAGEAIARHGGRDEPALLETLLALVGSAADPALVTLEDVERAMGMTGRGHGRDVARTPGVRFRDPPGVEEEAARLKQKIAETLVNAKVLPVHLPAFGLSLLDVAADNRGIDLILGPKDPVARLRLVWDKPKGAASVTVQETAPEARRWARAFEIMAARVEKAATAERFERAMEHAKQLARLPVGVPLGFFRQLVAGVEPPEGLVRAGFLCNQDCGMCWQGRDWGRYGPDQVVRWIEDLAAAGARAIILSGGEPTLDPDLFRYLDRARALGFTSITLETNAIQAGKPGYAARLAAAGITGAFVSLHSPDPAVSDAITRAPGTHERTVRGVRALLEAGVPVILNAVMTAEGLDTLGDLPDFIHATFGGHPKLTSLMISYPTEPFDRTLVPAIVPDPARLRVALGRAIDRAMELGIAVRGLDGPCGPPLCAFGADSRVISGKPIPAPVEFRRHLPACDGCAVKSACFGVRHVDVERFGEGCVAPLARAPEGARR
ncbi:radical SAM protein [Polyangium aurulentum]|uniref:radical SAM protein n=1 Tax=Polyangium aurulentum TaxID=2567896 RepID=UPI0010AE47AD|nr:radical SAM protein [Polyangium aurulentum]UQA60200.1 radical SAM protein [Polyangium aurulentum]